MRRLLVSLLLLASCSDAASTSSACAGDLAPGTVVEMATDLDWNTEGLTFSPDGRLFASTLGEPGRILEVFADGTYAELGTLPSSLGLAWHDGKLLVAGNATEALYEFDVATGDYATIVTNIGAANFVVTTPTGSVLVSDDFFDVNRISEVVDGVASVWLADIPSPNGLVFAPDGASLYVAATFEQEGLYRVTVNDDGSAGAFVQVVAFTAGSTPDGVAMDAADRVYVALNVAGEIVAVTPDGRTITIADHVRGAASLAFGRGNFDPCSLYVTNLLGRNLWRVVVMDKSLTTIDL